MRAHDVKEILIDKAEIAQRVDALENEFIGNGRKLAFTKESYRKHCGGLS